MVTPSGNKSSFYSFYQEVIMKHLLYVRNCIKCHSWSILINSLQKSCKVGIIITPNLQVKKLILRNCMYLAKHLRVSK